MGHGDEGVGLPGYDQWKTRTPDDDYGDLHDPDEEGEPMSKYPVMYHSKSKGIDLAIEDMPTPHLMNAWRKAGGAERKMIPMDTTDPRDHLIYWLAEELRSRGCTLDPETGRWSMPEAPNPGHDYAIGIDPAEGPVTP